MTSDQGLATGSPSNCFLAFVTARPHVPRVLEGRGVARGASRGRKVRTPQGAGPRNPGSAGDTRGRLWRKPGRQTVPQRIYRPGRKVWVRVKRRFKRPPPATQEAGHGKPPQEQDQIGNPWRGPRRFRASGTDSGYRLLRQMALSPAQAGKTEFGLQPFQDTSPPFPRGDAEKRRTQHSRDRPAGYGLNPATGLSTLRTCPLSRAPRRGTR